MPLRNASRTPLVESVIDQLREAIASGEWPVGSRIPTEPDLVAQLGVGRNTLREAVRALAHLGLLESRQGAGTYVRADSELAGAVRRRLAHAELRDLMEVRRAFEVEAARLAALRRTEEDLVVLRAALRARDEAWDAQDADVFVETDARFHHTVAECAHNRVLAELYADFGVQLRDILHTCVGETVRPEGYLSHTGLVDAIAAGDPDRAATEAARFLRFLPTG
ncbi:FadR/GntR family transcriptional regulator [Actinocatenispora rupis]|uniref:GntR family transcriptional regulator n=1 Tax=Actinocatenispora rupis TaxID=519421 RepID=A0A8J3J9A9_9ACTN|nr:FadR/GntR family transcriptional regulator [Actinocatenispora rupis]GID10638.1 GntR family transcriptional regulator [Actinocatenispora rupis]